MVSCTSFASNVPHIKSQCVCFRERSETLPSEVNTQHIFIRTRTTNYGAHAPAVGA